MNGKWKIARLTAFVILIFSAGILAALPYFAAKEPPPEESILSLAETLRGQRDELMTVKNHKQMRIKKTPHDTESIGTLSKREEEIKQMMQRIVAVYREKLREEIRHFHELEKQQKLLSRSNEARELHQGLIDAFGQSQANIIFWLHRSVQEAPRCYCVPSDVRVFLGGR